MDIFNKEENKRKDYLITIQDLIAFKADLLADIVKLLTGHRSLAANKWLKAAEVKKLLRISDGKLQYLRDRGVIPFKKLGGVTYYNYTEIEKLMNT